MAQYGVRLIIGKGGLRDGSAAAFRDLGGAYLAIIGGAAALETTWIEAIEDVDLDDLHPESLWKFRVRGFGPAGGGDGQPRRQSVRSESRATRRERRAKALRESRREVVIIATIPIGGDMNIIVRIAVALAAARSPAPRRRRTFRSPPAAPAACTTRSAAAWPRCCPRKCPACRRPRRSPAARSPTCS